MTPPEHPRKGEAGLKHVWDALFHSLDGLKAAYRWEGAFRLEVWIAAVLIPLALFLPASGTGKALMVASVFLVLIVELLNSSVEAAVDRVSQQNRSLAKRAKDIDGAAVLVSAVNVSVV
ncbi:diacylglycerol kinase [Pelomicrobium sp. G1]|uniref:diacylglycerol kinase n=1 Tax=unclassified Pelomicrobium TaxID=2815318 RepID=UPI003F7760C7